MIILNEPGFFESALNLSVSCPKKISGTEQVTLSLLEANPYHKIAVASLDPDKFPGIQHYQSFCRAARKFNFISRTGRENFSQKLDQYQLQKLFNDLCLTRENGEKLPEFLKVHVRLLLAWFSAHYDQQLGHDKTFINQVLTESKLMGQSYRISPHLSFQLACLDLHTPTHRYTLQKTDFWHLSPNINQINPQIVIFGPGDLFLRSVLPQLFALTEFKNSKKQSYLGDKTKIIVVGENQESDLLPFGYEAGQPNGAMNFKRYVLESYINKGIKIPADFEKVFEYIQYRAFPKSDEKSDFIEFLKDTRIGDQSSLFFLSVPPQAYRKIWSAIEPAVQQKDLVYFEKPFGIDESETENLNQMIQNSDRRSCVHVMDHYLGKEALALLLDCRRQFLDPYLNSNHVESVELVCAENLSVRGRNFYDGVGAIKDMLQSHMLGFFSLLAMDLPEAEQTTAQSFSRQKLDFLKTVPKFSRNDVVLGQYSRYPQDLGLEKSNTPTYFAAKLKLNCERWNDVEFKFMHGKELDGKYSQMVINFKTDISDPDCPSRAILAIYPNPRMLVWFKDTPDNQPEVIKLEENDVFRFRNDLHAEAYARLFLHALHGNPISNKPEEVLEQWRIISQITDPNIAPQRYSDNSRGPESNLRFTEKPDKDLDMRDLIEMYAGWF